MRYLVICGVGSSTWIRWRCSTPMSGCAVLVYRRCDRPPASGRRARQWATSCTEMVTRGCSSHQQRAHSTATWSSSEVLPRSLAARPSHHPPRSPAPLPFHEACAPDTPGRQAGPPDRRSANGHPFCCLARTVSLEPPRARFEVWASGATGGSDALFDVTLAEERIQLDAFVEEYRTSIEATLDALSEEQARRRLVPSATTLLGLLKHVTWMQRVWFEECVGGMIRRELGLARSPDESFELGNDDTITSVTAAHREACATARTIVANMQLDAVVTGHRAGPRTLRWVYLQVLRELALAETGGNGSRLPRFERGGEPARAAAINPCRDSSLESFLRHHGHVVHGRSCLVVGGAAGADDSPADKRRSDDREGEAGGVDCVLELGGLVGCPIRGGDGVGGAGCGRPAGLSCPMDPGAILVRG